MSIYDHFSEQQKEILRIRAERAAKALQSNGLEDQLTTLVVKVRNETYALPIDSVLGIYDKTAVVPVPCTPAFVAGIANIRGHILTVLDLGALLNVPGEVNGDYTALVVVSGDETGVALRVEAIDTVHALPTTTSPLEDSAQLHQSRKYLKGVLPDGTILLNVNEMLNDPALIVNDIVN